MSRHSFHRSLFLILATGSLVLIVPPRIQAQQAPVPPQPTGNAPLVVSPSSIVRKLQSTSEQMEMTVNTSRILELDQKIPQAQVNNPDLLHLTPLAPNQVQIAAKKAGVTQVNIWAENKQIYTVDVIIRGDARELAETLEAQFPTASLKVIPVANSVMITGFVAEPEQVNHVIRIAEEFYPKVINNITVGGVQQVLLHVRVMEVSRTKLRTLGFDFAQLSGNNMVTSGISGLLPVDVKNPVLTNVAGKNSHADLFNFQIVNGTNAFLGLLEALREDKLLKVLAEPTLVTISGRPAQFNVGGEIPILVPQSLGTSAIEYKKYGTQLDFVPIVLGNGKIRLEVRPKVSELDPASSISLNGVVVPGLLSREVETGVEMNAGQTLAIGGLVQTRLDANRRGLPWVSDLPYVGVLFRREEETNNEIELLILVTPQLVDPLDPQEVPPCGPGLDTTTPTDWELYMKGYLEVPKCCGNCGGKGCDQCKGGKVTKPEGNGAGLPGMINQPTPTPEETPTPAPQTTPSKPVAESAARLRTPNSYNPTNPQIPQAANDPGEKKALPGFMGQVGYETVR